MLLIRAVTLRLVHQTNQDALICIAWFTSSTRRNRAWHRSRLAAAVLHGEDQNVGYRLPRRNQARMRFRSAAKAAPIRFGRAAPRRERRSSPAARHSGYRAAASNAASGVRPRRSHAVA